MSVLRLGWTKRAMTAQPVERTWRLRPPEAHRPLLTHFLGLNRPNQCSTSWNGLTRFVGALVRPWPVSHHSVIRLLQSGPG